MNVEKISVRGSSEWNEDAWIINESIQLYGVLDGATSLTPFRGPNKETGGYLASQTVKGYLEAVVSKEDSHLRLEQMVLQANDQLRETMIQSGIDPTDKQSIWTTCVALVRIHEHDIEFAHAGDCMIFAIYEDGFVRSLTHDHIDHIDRQTRLLIEDGIRKGIRLQAELRAYVTPTIVENKLKMNTIEGYPVLSGEPELASFIECGRINRIKLKSLLMITDGLFMHQEKGQTQADIRELVKQIMEKTLAEYINELILQEQADGECQRYPRFKVSDDKTAIWLHF